MIKVLQSAIGVLQAIFQVGGAPSQHQILMMFLEENWLSNFCVGDLLAEVAWDSACRASPLCSQIGNVQHTLFEEVDSINFHPALIQRAKAENLEIRIFEHVHMVDNEAIKSSVTSRLHQKITEHLIGECDSDGYKFEQDDPIFQLRSVFEDTEHLPDVDQDAVWAELRDGYGSVYRKKSISDRNKLKADLQSSDNH